MKTDGTIYLEDTLRNKTNLLDNILFLFALQLDLQHVSTRITGHLQEVMHRCFNLELSQVDTTVVGFTIINIFKIGFQLI